MTIPVPGAATSIGNDLLGFFEALADMAVRGTFNLVGEGLEQLGQRISELILPLNELKDFGDSSQGKGGLNNLAAIGASLSLFATVASKLPGATQNLKDLADSINLLGGVTANEQKIIGGFADMLTGKVGASFKAYTEVLVAAAKEAQKFQVDMLKIGQNQIVIDSIRQQAEQLAELGISYADLKEATKATVTGIDASIRVTKEGTAEFEKNRLATQELMAFNKKFGIEMSESAKLVNLFNTSFGQGTQGAQLFSDSLEKFALKTGQDVNTVFKAFTSNMDYFATMSSPRALQAFASLEAFAKRSGQEVSKVVSNLEQFDDIATGYEKIGKLNRLLMQFGSSIDPQTFMDASPEEKQKMIIEATAQSQASFGAFTSETSRRQIAKAFSDATGQSVQLMSGLLSGNETARRDAIAALSQRPDMTGFTPEDKKALGKELSTSEDIGKLRDALIETKDSVQFLARGMRNESMLNVGLTRDLLNKLDKSVFASVATRDVGAYTKTVKEVFQGVGKQLADQIQGGMTSGSATIRDSISQALTTTVLTPTNKNLKKEVVIYLKQDNDKVIKLVTEE